MQYGERDIKHGQKTVTQKAGRQGTGQRGRIEDKERRTGLIRKKEMRGNKRFVDEKIKPCCC